MAIPMRGIMPSPGLMSKIGIPKSNGLMKGPKLPKMRKMKPRIAAPHMGMRMR